MQGILLVGNKSAAVPRSHHFDVASPSVIHFNYCLTILRDSIKIRELMTLYCWPHVTPRVLVMVQHIIVAYSSPAYFSVGALFVVKVEKSSRWDWISVMGTQNKTTVFEH